VVPDVTGENFLEALGAVSPPFRLLDVRYRVAPEVPNGTILEQRPPAGTSLEEADTDIRVVVSVSPGEQLRGTEWVLGLIGGRTWPIGDAPDVTLSFGLHRFEGFSGCNEYSAGYRMDGWRLVLGRVTTTLIACTGERAWVEDRFFEILNGSPVATARQKELRLTSRREGVAVFDQA
jgi:heat shock protein HslJ